MIVIGAGVAGLAAAKQLHGLGVKVRRLRGHLPSQRIRDNLPTTKLVNKIHIVQRKKSCK